MTNAKLQTRQLWTAMKKTLGESVIFRVYGKRDEKSKARQGKGFSLDSGGLRAPAICWKAEHGGVRQGEETIKTNNGER